MRIGIVTPAYNVAPWLGATLSSAVAQTHTDWSLVVVDDGSTDDTAAIATGFYDPRIRLIRQANAGVAAARNAGLSALDACETIVFLDADDLLAPDALARLAATLTAAPDAVAAYGAYQFVTEDAATVTLRRPGPFPAGNVLETLLVRNLFANGGHVLIRRAAAEATGGFPRGISYGEDWVFFARLARLGPFAVAPGAAPLLSVRQRPSGAYLRMASDPTVFAPCMDAIFTDPALADRFGARLAGLRTRCEGENAWIAAREKKRHRRPGAFAALARAAALNPTPKRLALLALATATPVLPRACHGPFRAYG